MKTDEILQKVVLDSCDTERLYGPLPDAIAYLQEMHAKHPEAKLHEEWSGYSGYEKMEMTFRYTRPETDEELRLRKVLEQAKAKAKYEAEERRRKKERAADFEKLEALKRKLGVR